MGRGDWILSPVESRRPLGVPQGLNLAVDTAQTVGLIIADGVRFDEVGTLVGRLGRKRLNLSFPYEGYGIDATIALGGYKEEIAHLIAPSSGVRGYSQFYDQRITTQVAELLDNVDMVDRDGSPQGMVGWEVRFDFAFNLDRGHAIYIEGGSGFGELEPVNWLGTPLKDTLYEITYVISQNNPAAPDATLTIYGGPFSKDNDNIVLPVSIGEHRVQVRTNDLIAPTRLIFAAESAPGGQASSLTIDSVSLKQVRDFGVDNLPERVNILHKGADSKIYLNNSVAGGVDGIVAGDITFEDSTTRVKFVSHGKDVYVIDESTRPILFRRRPLVEQAYADRVLYDVRDASLRWPRPESGRPSIAQVVGGTNFLPLGIYRVRVQFEDEFGHLTGPSMQRSYQHGQPGQVKLDHLIIEYNHLLGLPPLDRVTHVNVYMQFTRQGDDALEPSIYKFFRRHKIGAKDEAADEDNSVRFTAKDYGRQPTGSHLDIATGEMPKLRDFVIVNDVGFGIASYDTVFREETKNVSAGVGSAPSGQFNIGEEKQFDTTEIKEVHLDPSFLMVSEPGRPYQMQRFFPIAGGNEIGIGLSTVGDVVFVHTNVGIHSFTADPPTFKRIPSSVGTMTRDSIQEDEKMIRFMGDDGVPRLFNGATIEETATELLPIFDQEDYIGYYQKFDRTRASAVSSASGKRRYYLNFPTALESGNVSQKPSVGGPSNNLAIADMSKGRALWAVDRTPYEMIAWMGRDSRLSAVNDVGEFYFIEEGFEDEGVEGSTPTNPPMIGAVRRFGRFGFTTRFFRFAVEIDTQGQDVTLTCSVDEDVDITETYTVNTTMRERVDFGLPGYFKGLYLEIKFSGFTTTSGRVRVYDLKVDLTPLGRGI